MPVTLVTGAADMLAEPLNHETATITLSRNQALLTDKVVEVIWHRAIQRKEVKIMIPCGP
jgi:hypothetical protein